MRTSLPVGSLLQNAICDVVDHKICHTANDNNLHLILHLSGICGDTADVIDIGIPHVRKLCRCLAASCTGVAVDKQGRVFIFCNGCHIISGFQRYILASGDVSFPLFLRHTYIQQDGISRAHIFLNACADIRLLEKTKNAHNLSPSLVYSIRIPAFVLYFCDYITKLLSRKETCNCKNPIARGLYNVHPDSS